MSSIGGLGTDEAGERLRSVFSGFRTRSAVVAAEIAREFPEFTVHDISHLDALWELADLIVGNAFELTPTEAFVLGGAFLVHDLGMATSALPDGKASIQADPLWNDVLASRLRLKLGRQPSDLEMAEPDNDSEIEALGEYLRLRHAQRASRIPLAEYRHPQTGEGYHLIEDPEIRLAFGEVIGLIAYSHWFSIEELRRRFGDLPPLGAPSFLHCPPEWTVDRLKLAGVLRTADSAHIDSRRAPGFLRVLRKPDGYADLHWKFQGALNQAQRVADRLVFTSGRAFPIEDHEAWWVGFDLLRNCDLELRRTDALFQDLGRLHRFEARCVAGVEEPERLRQFIPTVGWEPVNATIQISNVAALVSTLGGKELYGNDLTVPIRELIQNASDAVRARRLLEERSGDWGNVTLAIGQDSFGEYIEVVDTGVGMSQAVLIGPFLDFGSTLWGTPMMRDEFPGLSSKGFEPTGKFGIGFFSVFMLGDRVKVTTRRLDASMSETRVVEFEAGLRRRPLLRFASADEYTKEAGTTVRVWTREGQRKRGLLSILGGWNSLAEFCRWLCPTIDVNIFVREGKQISKVISASDWEQLESKDLLKRLWIGDGHRDLKGAEEFISEFASRITPVTDSAGVCVGRAGVACEDLVDRKEFRFFGSMRWHTGTVVTVGGLRAFDAGPNTFGAFIGVTKVATRQWATALADDEAFARWSSEQAAAVSLLDRTPMQLESAAQYIAMCGGHTGRLPIARNHQGWVSAEDIAQWAECPDEVLLVESSENESADMQLDEHVLSVSSARKLGFPIDMHELSEQEYPQRTGKEEEQLGWWWFNESTLPGAVVAALAKRWGTTVERVQQVSDMPVEWGLPQRRIGRRNGTDVVKSVRVVRRPGALQT